MATDGANRVGGFTNTLHDIRSNGSHSLQLGEERLELSEESRYLVDKVPNLRLATKTKEGVGCFGGIEGFIDKRDVVPDVSIVELLPEDPTKAHTSWACLRHLAGSQPGLEPPPSSRE